MEAKIEKMRQIFTKDPEELKNRQTEMNNTLEAIHSRITEAEEWINDLEGCLAPLHLVVFLGFYLVPLPNT